MMDYYYSKKWPKNHQDFLSFFFLQLSRCRCDPSA